MYSTMQLSAAYNTAIFLSVMHYSTFRQYLTLYQIIF